MEEAEKWERSLASEARVETEGDQWPVCLSCGDTECLDGCEEKLVWWRLGRDEWNQPAIGEARGSLKSSEETWSYVQEEIKEDVGEWILGAAAVDVEWRFHRQGCSGPARTYEYFHLFSVQVKNEERSAPWIQAEEGKAIKTNAALRQCQHQRRTRGMLEMSRGGQGITSEVVRTFQRDGMRARQLLERMQSFEEKRGQRMTQRSKKSTRCRTSSTSRRLQDDDWKAMEAEKKALPNGVVAISKKCVQEAVSEDRELSRGEACIYLQNHRVGH